VAMLPDVLAGWLPDVAMGSDESSSDVDVNETSQAMCRTCGAQPSQLDQCASCWFREAAMRAGCLELLTPVERTGQKRPRGHTSVCDLGGAARGWTMRPQPTDRRQMTGFTFNMAQVEARDEDIFRSLATAISSGHARCNRDLTNSSYSMSICSGVGVCSYCHYFACRLTVSNAIQDLAAGAGKAGSPSESVH